MKFFVFCFALSQSNLKYGSENRPWVRGLINHVADADVEDDAHLALVNGHSGHEEDMPGQARIYKMTEKEEHAGHTPEQHQARVAI